MCVLVCIRYLYVVKRTLLGRRIGILPPYMSVLCVKCSNIVVVVVIVVAVVVVAVAALMEGSGKFVK